MKKVKFVMKDAMYFDGNLDAEAIEMRLIERVESIMRAVRAGGMELSDCMSWGDPREIQVACPHCGGALVPSGIGTYGLLCPECDEDLYEFECRKEAGE